MASVSKELANTGKDFSTRDVKKVANQVKREAGDAMDSFVEDLSDYAHQAGERVRGFIASASDDVAQATDRVADEIRENPMRSGLIALGMGVVLGFLLRR